MSTETLPSTSEDGGNEAEKQAKFHVDMDLIPSANLNEDADGLKALGIDVFNQEDLEQGLMQQVDDAITKEEERRKKESLKKDLKTVNDNIRTMKHELASLATQIAQLGSGRGGADRRLVSAKKQKETKLAEMKQLEEKKKKISAKLDGRAPLFDEQELALKSMVVSSGNKEKDDLIKTGEMTPFGTVVNRQDQSESNSPVKVKEEPVDVYPSSSSGRPTTSRSIKREHPISDDNDDDDDDDDVLSDTGYHDDDGDEWLPEEQLLEDSDVEDDADDDTDVKLEDSKVKKVLQRKQGKKKKKKWSKKFNRPIYTGSSDESDTEEKPAGLPRSKAIRKYRDDGHEDYYHERIEKFNKHERYKQKMREAGRMSDSEEDEEFDGGLKVPGRVWSKLYKYQKTCVKWLWELHCQQAGGIVGDEMGLGKTIQAIAFLTALKYSKIRSRNFNYVGLGPCIIVCPATVMHQWVKEFHTWWPVFRVAILHGSGTFMGKEKDLIRQISKNNGILITSYSTLVLQQEHLLSYNWHYVILDEGHKIRNPDVKATLVCKQFRTPHRVILSGSPIQNNLKELWSLMDFVFPGKLGTLPDFMQHLAVPIVQGGYSNASDVQVQAAYKCACVLRDTINPYLLRRMKADVKLNINLPGKNEQVLFCRLSQDQRDVYEEYLASRECQEILRGRLMVFAGLIQLRKICNHPDLATGGPRVFDDEKPNDRSLEYGYYKRAGKMIVVDALLKLWKKQGHRALIFTQSRQMLDVMERYVQHKGYSYVRMDGGTGISSRQPLVQKYNTDESIYVFLLTTRVGGLGVNLVGANRIIIYDPDWNPSTDMQARERAWRIGQKRQVTIYRLLTTGTIEEKIYHRQIFKQFLTNRVLKDPKQRRLFKTNDMYELFSLGLSDDKGETETAAIFAGTGSDVTVKPVKMKNRFDKMKEEKKKAEQEKEDNYEDIERNTQASLNSDEDEIKRMREMAKMLSKKIENEKMKDFMKTADKSENGGSGSNSVDKSSCNHGEKVTGGSHGNNVVSKEITNVVSSDSRSNSPLNTNTSTTPGSLKHFKIRKRPSGDLYVADKEIKVEKSAAGDTADVSGKTNVLKQKTHTTTHSSHSKHSEGRDSRDDRQKDRSSSHGKVDRHKDRSEKKRDRDNNEHGHSKHKKKKHKRRDAKFEGERIPHLDKLRDFKQPKQPEQNNEEDDAMNNYVLSKLFKKTGIQGALKHDQIMEPGKPDYVIVEAEADKVAKEASSALKRSRSFCLPATAGVPTWTGQHGAKRPRFGQKKSSILSRTEPGPSEPKKDTETKSKEQHFDGSLAGSVQTNIESGSSAAGAVSSNDLLNKMRTRNEVFSTTGEGEDDDNNEDTDGFVSDPSSLELIKRMREFILFEGQKFGQSTTQELLDEFGSQLPPENSAKFRALLRSICDFEKKDGQGVWKLRQDFK